MYAVVKTGGKQYKVSPGDTLRVEKLPADAGTEIRLEEVLMVVDGERILVGAPRVEGASVVVAVAGHGRGEKVRIVKFRRRKHYRKRQGHRQHYTELEILAVNLPG